MTEQVQEEKKETEETVDMDAESKSTETLENADIDEDADEVVPEESDEQLAIQHSLNSGKNTRSRNTLISPLPMGVLSAKYTSPYMGSRVSEDGGRKVIQ